MLLTLPHLRQAGQVDEFRDLVIVLEDVAAQLKMLMLGSSGGHTMALRASLSDLEAAIYNLERNVIGLPVDVRPL